MHAEKEKLELPSESMYGNTILWDGTLVIDRGRKWREFCVKVLCTSYLH